jgi:O-acetyl-ADP-ribose deacetylase (regulator of RNase III)
VLGNEYRLPRHEELTRELRLLREKGILRLRRITLPALDAAAQAAGFATEPGDARAIELLLRRAVQTLGDEEPGQAAQYLFGLVQGTAGRRPTDLRERAARCYGLAPETFRKEPERLLIDRIAQEILLLCPSPGQPPVRTVQRHPPVPPPEPVEHPPLPDVHAAVELALRRVHGMVHMDPDDRYRFGRYGPFDLPFSTERALVTVDLGAVEELQDVDIIVSSENTYLEPARVFTTTLSGQLRSAAAVRDATGVIVHDVIAEELSAWIRRNARPGNPVEPGVVAVTSPGELARNGVRQILHAAVASPRRGWNGYDVPETGVMRAVHRCFEIARVERAEQPSIGSITIPLFGAGDGGLDPEASFSRLWPAVQQELEQDPTWHVHLTTWTIAETAAVLQGLLPVFPEWS